MASTITDELKEQIGCCLVNKADTHITDIGRGLVNKACNVEFINEQFVGNVLYDYVPNGTLLQAGFTASVTIDMDSATAGVNILGYIYIDDPLVDEDPWIIGIIPEANYATVPDLVAAVVAAINAMSGTTGFTAVDNGDNTLTISAPPGSGTTLNGSTVNIILNPSFEWFKTYTHTNAADGTAKTGVMWGHTQVDDADSFINGNDILTVQEGTPGPYEILEFYNTVLIKRTTPGDIGIVSNRFSPNGIAYNPTENTVHPTNINPPYGEYALDENIMIQQDPFNRNDSLAPAIFAPTVNAAYNPTNTWVYYSGFAKLLALDKDNAYVDQINVNAGVGTTGKIEVDTDTGRIWVAGSLGFEVFTNANPITSLIAVVLAKTITDFAYYPGTGVPGTERMFLVNATDGVIASYNVDGTVDAAVFYTSTLASISRIMYSPAYNVLFLGGAGMVEVVRLDGTLRETFNPWGAGSGTINDFSIDVNNNFMTSKRPATPGTDADLVAWARLSDDGNETFTASIINGIPDTFQEEGDQCVEESLMNTLGQSLEAECGSDCSTTAEIINTNTGVTYTIYYGNSANAALDNTGVAALTALSKSGYVGTYSYGAAAGEYKYFAYPAALGTPSKFEDTATLLDVVMDTPYSVDISGTTYTVYRSFNILGGAITMEVKA